MIRSLGPDDPDWPLRVTGFVGMTLHWVAAVAGLALMLMVVAIPLDLMQQAAFGSLTIVMLLGLIGSRSRLVSIILVLLSAVVTSRYMFWRINETMGFESVLEAVLGFGLYSAEIYRVTMQFTGYLPTIWPLRRRPVPMVGRPDDWPTVDVMIPTYNESLSIVRTTVLAALSLDYPREKFRVHLLDDGRRPEFAAFAAEAGVHYITRPDNRHAKAGNLNHALTRSTGDLIVVFDCDHITTRAFLQLTVGWFQRDPKIAVLQTPHHFYSQDPFERNLKVVDTPNEDKLFYGLIQDGNDLWNATFFCGSCAIIRRSAVDQIGGFAVETVTEDAHTALKLHRLGYKTAYIGMPLAAGLATERLSLHIGQRMRWARGMTQIFRRDNPLLVSGLSLFQRICYLNAMMFFFFALPRIVFLTSPLAFLLLDANIIHATAASVMAYVVPMTVHTLFTNSHIQGRYRHSFWNEVYESSLAFYLLGPTLVTLWDPKRGKFNVTDKGGKVDIDFVDRRVIRPHLVLIGLLALGLAVGVVRYFVDNPLEPRDTLLFNLLWASINLMVIGAAVGVARESRQVRTHVRLRTSVPVTIWLPDGRSVSSNTEDISLGGASIPVPRPDGVEDGVTLILELPVGNTTAKLPAKHVSWSQRALRVRFPDMPIGLERELVKVVMCRADAWTHWDNVPPDNVWRSLGRIFGLGIRTLAGGAVYPARVVLQRIRPPQPGPAARRAGAAVVAAVVLGAAAAAQAPAHAQGPALAVPAGGVPVERDYSLRSLGAERGVSLRTTDMAGSLYFQLPRAMDVTGASLTLDYTWSPSLITALSHLVVLVNDEPVRALPLLTGQGTATKVEIPIPPALLRPSNRLGFHFVGHYARDCEDPLSAALWSTVGRTSVLHMTGRRLLLPNDLALLPLPFFDDHDPSPLRVPVMLAQRPSAAVLQGAGIVASWFGALGGFRTARFPVVLGNLSRGNAIAFALPNESPPGLTVGAITGPSVRVVANPVDPDGKILVIMGRDAEELRMAAAGLALGSAVLSGPAAQVDVHEPPPRRPYDAPRWIPSDRPVRFGEFARPEELQATGFLTSIGLNFHSAPDLFVWHTDGIPVTLQLRRPEGDWIDQRGSRIDVYVNGGFVKAEPLLTRNWWSHLQYWAGNYHPDEVMDAPTPPFYFSGQNRLEAVFDIKPLQTAQCADTIPSGVRVGIEPSSTIDLSRTPHYAVMPDLAYFANAVFPFTRMADLSESAAVLSETPSAEEIEVFLTVMGMAGASTGYPALKLRVVPPDAVEQVAGRDLLVIGLYGHHAFLDQLADRAPVRAELGRIVAPRPLVIPGGPAPALQPTTSNGGRLAVIYGVESPLAPERSVVVVAATAAARLAPVLATLTDPDRLGQVRGGLVLFDGDQTGAVPPERTYNLGRLPWITWLRWHLANRLFETMAGVLLGCLLLGGCIYSFLYRTAARRLQAGS